MKKASLTYPQQRELDALAKDQDRYCGSCTNATMCALERRGLVRSVWTEVDGSPYRKHRWAITEQGRAVAYQWRAAR